MADKQAGSDLDTTKRQPVSARLLAERRNVAARHALRRRIQHEFAEMPGLSLTLAQASRLFGVAQDVCVRIFNELAEEGLLCHEADAQPQRGDVVIAAEPGPQSGYTLSQWPDPPQLRYSTRNEAVATARRFAKTRPGIMVLMAREDATFAATGSALSVRSRASLRQRANLA